MAWNTLSDETTGRWFTWITRFWNKKFGGWYVWMDDPYYHAYMNAMSGDWQTGRMSVQATIDNNVPEGNFACLMSELTEWVDRSQPPIGSFMVWKYYLLTGDRALLDAVYPALRDANFWWHTHRDGNGNGVYEYGSSPVGKGHFAHTKLAAMDESSMDNCPIYDKATYIPETHTLDMEDVALNSLLIVDGECLQAMAKIVGDGVSIPRLHSLTETLREKGRRRALGRRAEDLRQPALERRIRRSLPHELLSAARRHAGRRARPRSRRAHLQRGRVLDLRPAARHLEAEPGLCRQRVLARARVAAAQLYDVQRSQALRSGQRGQPSGRAVHGDLLLPLERRACEL